MTEDPIAYFSGPIQMEGGERDKSERRRHLRFPFTAAVDAIEPRSETKLSGRTSDLSSSGCYVDSLSPFPTGTAIRIRLTRQDVVFEAEAKVVSSQVGMGMGVEFVSATPKHVRIFQTWLNELTGKTAPRIEASERAPTDAAKEDSKMSYDYVLGELLLTLVRKGVLGEAEGKAMLQKLYR